MVKLKAFSKFENTTEALAGAAALTDSKLSKGLKKFLKKNAAADELAVLDAKLGGLIKEKLGIQCIWRCGRTLEVRLRPAAVAGRSQHDVCCCDACSEPHACLFRASPPDIPAPLQRIVCIGARICNVLRCHGWRTHRAASHGLGSRCD